MYTKVTSLSSTTISGIIGLFFILILHIKISYTFFPLLVALIGLGIIGQHLWHRKKIVLNRQEKWIIAIFGGYFLLFLLSLIIHHGRGRELDLPSKLIFLLPVFAVFHRSLINQWWVLVSLLSATLIGAIVAIIQHFGLKMEQIFPIHMYIQSGGIMMSFAFFSLVSAFFFHQRQIKIGVIASLVIFMLGVFTTLINQSRGSWVVAPILLFVTLWLYRKVVSKKLLGISTIALLLGGITISYITGDLIQTRWEQATQDITQYIEGQNHSTSLGARFDMWKSAIIGIQENPLFGWGLEGVKAMRHQHYQQQIITQMASSFDHAHNQYLHDTTTRGILGFIALLAIFIVPLRLFWQTMRRSEINTFCYLWGSLGIIHILAIMGYCLTQSFLSHNSGIMFYGFTMIVFLGLQKIAEKSSLSPSIKG